MLMVWKRLPIEAVWVTDGIDRCRVGFLPRHLVKHHKQYEGKLAQVVDIYKDSDSPTKKRKHHKNRGCCLAAVISPTYHSGDRDRDEDDHHRNKRQKTGEQGGEKQTE